MECYHREFFGLGMFIAFLVYFWLEVILELIKKEGQH